MTHHYQELLKLLREAAVLDSAIAVLGWDERVNLPHNSTEGRAEQLSTLARMHHAAFTAPRIGELLSEVESSLGSTFDPQSDIGVNIRWTRRAFDRATKLPPTLVEELSKTASLGEAAWADARAKSDFKSFEPWLAKQIDLKRQQAKCYGYREHIYDALLEDYEPLATTSQITKVFGEFRPPLVKLIRSVLDSSKKAPIEILNRKYPVAAQSILGRHAAERIGFDFSHGRIDTSVHPFCTSLGRGDTRMTTRFDEHDFSNGFFSTLHETGHAMYDQGLPAAHWGTPRGLAVSLGIHESQSRTWECLVGRSRAFWKFMYPAARGAFPESLGDVSENDFVFAVNDIRASYIRTEADEATYNLHVMLRFDFEQAMLLGDLKPADLPAAWNARMREDFGITPPDDRRGCLQDTHWAAGLFGYFPTYALGNMIAAQFFEKAKADCGDLDAQFAAGDFSSLLNWMRKNVHQFGMTFAPRDLIKHVTGKDLSPAPLLAHLARKANEFYGI